MNQTTTIEDHISQGHARFFELVKQFPNVADAPGAQPWDAHRFAAWASNLFKHNEEAKRQSAAFLLSVWNNRNGTPDDPAWFNEDEFSVGYFDAVRANMVWSYAERAAFYGWILKPFWP